MFNALTHAVILTTTPRMPFTTHQEELGLCATDFSCGFRGENTEKDKSNAFLYLFAVNNSQELNRKSKSIDLFLKKWRNYTFSRLICNPKNAKYLHKSELFSPLNS